MMTFGGENLAAPSLCGFGFAFPLSAGLPYPPETSLSRLIALTLSWYPCGTSSLIGYASKTLVPNN